MSDDEAYQKAKDAYVAECERQGKMPRYHSGGRSLFDGLFSTQHSTGCWPWEM